MAEITYKFEAFDFTGICQTVSLSLCPVIGTANGVEAVCYSRNIDMGSNMIFQPATLVTDIVAIIMTIIMIYHVRSKYTAVGRKEIVIFFFCYILTCFFEMLLVTDIIPSASEAYPWLAAVHTGLISATFWCLLLNGFVGFQFMEDGTPLSLWSIRISSFLMFILVGFISIATFKEIGPFSYTSPGALWAFYFIVNGICFIVYVISQIVLVLRTLDDRWPLGDILFGAAFFIVGMVILFIFSVVICDQIKHYVDGMFFAAICTLLSVMMVYKYWDSITKEDLEFSVGSKQNVWELKDATNEEELKGDGSGVGFGGPPPPPAGQYVPQQQFGGGPPPPPMNQQYTGGPPPPRMQQQQQQQQFGNRPPMQQQQFSGHPPPPPQQQYGQYQQHQQHQQQQYPY